MKTQIAAGLFAALLAPAAVSAATLDFDTFGNGAPSSAGNLTGNEFAQLGVLLSSNKQLALFNSNCGPDNPPATCVNSRTDSDLATGPSFGSAPEGNVLILNGGTDAEPNDDADGGIFRFNFAEGIVFQSIRLLDLDEAGLFNKVSFKFTFADASTREFSGNGDLANRSTLLNPGFPGDNSVRDIRFGLANVTELELTLNDISGAVASVGVAPVPLPAGLPLLAAGLGGLALVRRMRAKA